MKTRKLDLSKATRDELLFALSAAKGEIDKYANCKEDRELCEQHVIEVHSGAFVFFILLGIMAIAMASVSIYNGYMRYTKNVTDVPEFVIFCCAILSIISLSTLINLVHKRNTALRKIAECSAQLPELKREEEEAFDKFYEVVEQCEFPRDYWDKYAITTMLKFVEKKQSNTWREVVKDYEEHLHYLRKEDNGRQILDEIKRQSDDIKRAGNAARWAAAGAWLR